MITRTYHLIMGLSVQQPTNTGWRVAQFGGNYNDGTVCGPAAWNLNNDSSNSNANIGCRLLVFSDFARAYPRRLPKNFAIGRGLVGLLHRNSPKQTRMKRIGYLYEQICSYENCKTAILAAVKGKKNRRVVKRVSNHLEKYAYALSQMLARETYQLSPYREVIIIDGPSQKERDIQVPAFWPDQCIHHALMGVLRPMIVRSSYYWSCGSIPNRGINRGMRGVENATQVDTKQAKYCAKMDISKFYSSIPCGRLKDSFRKIIKDARALRLIDTIIDSRAGGLPIGNYTSAWFANFYLRTLDNFIKAGEAAGGLGIKHYIRYVDDMVLFSNNKKKLHAAMSSIMEFIGERLGLRIKGNWQVFLVKRDRRMRGKKSGRPVDFLGYCFSIGYTTLRKRNALALMRRSRRLQKRIEQKLPISYRAAAGFLSRIGQAKHCDSFGLKKAYIDVIPLKILKEVVRRESKRRQCATGGLRYRAAAG